MVLEAVKVALDPSPVQERLLLSHAGAARFAFNAGLAHVKDALDAGDKPEWSFYSLVRWWNSNKDTLATLSDGTVIENPRPLRKAERRLKRAQKALSRKVKGSNRRAKARAKVARLHAHVANQRLDAIHKATTWLTQTYSYISVEDLNAVGMVKNHRLAKAVSDAAFGEFRRQLEYKTARTGAALHVVDRWYPSSKTCSSCGAVKAKLSLNERVYRCEHCGLTMDRDLNAAVNILVAGSAPETQNAHRGTVRRSNQHGCATQVPVKCEPSVGGNVVSDLERVPAKTPCKQSQTSL